MRVDARQDRRGAALWGWGLAGAIAVPAILAAEGDPRLSPALVGLCWTLAGVGIAAGGAITAMTRHEASWRAAAITWGLAFVIGAVTYAWWPSRLDPLARPGAVNVVTLPQSQAGREVGFFTSIEWRAVWQVAAPLWLAAATGGLLTGRRLAPTGRTLPVGTLTAAAWMIGVTIPAPLVLVCGVYGTHIVGELFQPVSEAWGHGLGWAATGALTGLSAATVGERTLDRLLLQTTNESG